MRRYSRIVALVVALSQCHGVSLAASSTNKAPTSYTACSGVGAPDKGIQTDLFTLRPTPGLTAEAQSSVPVTRSVLMTLPRYPGTALWHAALPTIGLQYPLSPYLVAARRSYAVRASVDVGQIDRWYRGALSRQGLVVSGSSQAQDPTTEQSASATYFTCTGHPSVGLDLSYQHGAAGATTLLLLAFAVDVPERPRSTMLPTGVTRVLIAYLHRSSAQRWSTDHITLIQRRDVAAMIAAFNALTLSAGRLPCLGDSSASATITFLRVGHQPVTVMQDPACSYLTMTGLPLTPDLYDGHMHFWQLVQHVATRNTLPLRGRE